MNENILKITPFINSPRDDKIYNNSHVNDFNYTKNEKVTPSWCIEDKNSNVEVRLHMGYYEDQLPLKNNYNAISKLEKFVEDITICNKTHQQSSFQKGGQLETSTGSSFLTEKSPGMSSDSKRVHVQPCYVQLTKYSILEDPPENDEEVLVKPCYVNLTDIGVLDTVPKSTSPYRSIKPEPTEYVHNTDMQHISGIGTVTTNTYTSDTEFMKQAIPRQRHNGEEASIATLISPGGTDDDKHAERKPRLNTSAKCCDNNVKNRSCNAIYGDALDDFIADEFDNHTVNVVLSNSNIINGDADEVCVPSNSRTVNDGPGDNYFLSESNTLNDGPGEDYVPTAMGNDPSEMYFPSDSRRLNDDPEEEFIPSDSHTVNDDPSEEYIPSDIDQGILSKRKKKESLGWDKYNVKCDYSNKESEFITNIKIKTPPKRKRVINIAKNDDKTTAKKRKMTTDNGNKISHTTESLACDRKGKQSVLFETIKKQSTKSAVDLKAIVKEQFDDFFFWKYSMRCLNCKQEFEDRDKFKYHIFNEKHCVEFYKSGKEFHCTPCNYVTGYKCNLLQHLICVDKHGEMGCVNLLKRCDRSNVESRGSNINDGDSATTPVPMSAIGDANNVRENTINRNQEDQGQLKDEVTKNINDNKILRINEEKCNQSENINGGLMLRGGWCCKICDKVIHKWTVHEAILHLMRKDHTNVLLGYKVDVSFRNENSRQLPCAEEQGPNDENDIGYGDVGKSACVEKNGSNDKNDDHVTTSRSDETSEICCSNERPEKAKKEPTSEAERRFKDYMTWRYDMKCLICKKEFKDRTMYSQHILDEPHCKKVYRFFKNGKNYLRCLPCGFVTGTRHQSDFLHHLVTVAQHGEMGCVNVTKRTNVPKTEGNETSCGNATKRTSVPKVEGNEASCGNVTKRTSVPKAEGNETSCGNVTKRTNVPKAEGNETSCGYVTKRTSVPKEKENEMGCGNVTKRTSVPKGKGNEIGCGNVTKGTSVPKGNMNKMSIVNVPVLTELSNEKGCYLKGSELKRVDKPRKDETDSMLKGGWHCKICNVTIHQWYAYHAIGHIKRYHTNKAYQCKICHRPFYNEKTFNGHLKEHDDNPTHQCAMCGKIFKASINLYDHEAHAHKKRRLVNLQK